VPVIEAPLSLGLRNYVASGEVETEILRGYLSQITLWAVETAWSRLRGGFQTQVCAFWDLWGELRSKLAGLAEAHSNSIRNRVPIRR